MPLSGITVLDLTRVFPGPYCTMLLADMGAKIIKVDEVSPRFDPKETFLGSNLIKDCSEHEKLFNAYRFIDRGKKRICLDLKKKEGKEILFKMASEADVLVEEFRPGVSKRLGFDYDSIKKINPMIIYCSITSYGQDGPYSNFVGHNSNYLGIAGALAIKDTQHDVMTMPSIAVGDFVGGLHGTVGILAALLSRDKLGKGRFIDISMTDCLFSLVMIQRAVPFFLRQYKPARGDAGAVIYLTKDDKYISIVPVEKGVWENTCSAIGLEELAPFHDEMLEAVLPTGRKVSIEKTDEIKAKLSATFKTKTRDEWFMLLSQRGSSAGPVYTLEEALSDPQLRHRQIIHEYEHPSLGKIFKLGTPLKFSGTTVVNDDFACVPGQHTEEILEDLGFSIEEIKALESKKVVRGHSRINLNT